MAGQMRSRPGLRWKVEMVSVKRQRDMKSGLVLTKSM